MDDAVIIGNGVVGKATGKAMNIPWYFDPLGSNITLEEASKKQFIIFCTPTPTDLKGEQKGIDIIDGYIKQIKGYGGRNIFIIKSTVLPGTTKHLAQENDVMVGFWPEFLSDVTAEYDAQNPIILVVGADDIPTKIALENLVKKLNVKGKRFISTDTVTAEMIKYTFNLFFLTKVIFANQIYDICQVNGANYRTIREALYAHPWGTHHHLKPIHKGGRGGGGKCFPKDIKAFSKYSNLKLFKVVNELNDEYLQASQKQ
jgi:UDPglucose 6-dehydrogenase